MTSRFINYSLLVIILLLGLFLRLEVVKHTDLVSPIMSDAADYTAYAYNLRMHATYSHDISTISNPSTIPEADALRSPGYPLFLAPLTSLNDLPVFQTRVAYIQVILSMLTLLLTYIIARHIFNHPASLIILFVTAISPHLINMNVYILTETIFAFFLVGTAVLIIKSIELENIPLIMLGTCSLAIASLIRPTIQFFIIFELILLWHYWSASKRPVVIASAIAIFAGILSIWLIRNWITLGVVSDSTLTINALHHGMYPGFMFNNIEETFAYPYRYDPESPTISSSVTNTLNAIWNRFNTDMIASMQWYLSKPLYLFQWEIIQGNDEIFIYRAWASPYYLDDGIFPATLSLMKHTHPLFIWLSFAGTILAFAPAAKQQLKPHQLLAIRICSLIYLYFILIHVAVAPFPRYSIPIRPFTYILAVFSVIIAIETITNKLQLTNTPSPP